MGAKKTSDEERRVSQRRNLALRVDLKVLPPREVEDILEGSGYADLSVSTPALSRPRSGMDGMKTLDVSASGIGIRSEAELEPGAATAVDLHLPGQRMVLKFLGEVMWATRVGAETRAGLRIAALDINSAQRFSGFLSKLS